MPPLTDNQREAELRAIIAQVQRDNPNLFTYREMRRIAEDRIDRRKHLRGSFR